MVYVPLGASAVGLTVLAMKALVDWKQKESSQIAVSLL